MSISGADRTSPTGIPNEDGVHRKEVDYYLNPTELFRWINYRRWDGAKARVLSHAEECSTWIVSRHNNDGRILWRHLPLHLVCMQSDATGMEELVDILLDAYPDAASSPDDQGMLPLHLTVANCIKPNERLIHLLLLCYPTGVDIKDKYGRTPLDLVKEKAENGPHRDAALRAMARAKATTQTLVHALRDENTEVIANQLKTHANERMASQRIIMRLEEDLDITRKRMDELLETSTAHTGTAQQLAQQVDHLKQQLESSHNTTLSVRRERDELMHQSELLETQVNDHDRIVSRLHEDIAHDRQSQSDMIANLRSEVSTAKAMATALESQLKSRFTNEEYLTTTVTELETKLSDMTIDHQQERKALINERDKYETENTQLQRQVDELSKKSGTLQTKLVAVNKQMSAVLSSHGALNAEHDRILDANLRLEADLIEHSRSERTNIMASLKKQWETMETTLKHQENLIAEAEQKEQEILSQAKDERDRSLDVISRMRQDFRDARSSALERARGIPPDIASGVNSIAGSGKSDPHLEPRASERAISGSSQHLDARSIGSHTHAPSSIQGGSVVPSTSSSQPTRRINSRSEDTLSLPSIIKSDVTPGFFGKHGVSSLRQCHVESRTPSADVSMERRQATEQQQQMDRNLLQMLEARAGDGHRSLVSSNESSTFGTTSTASSIRRMSTQANKPRLINMPRVNFDSSTTSSHSSSPRNASRQSSTQNYSREPKCAPLMSLDDYSQSQSASVDSDSDSASTRESAIQHHSKNSQYSGMTAGMRMGMIRIAEEDSVGSDADSRYSR